MGTVRQSRRVLPVWTGRSAGLVSPYRGFVGLCGSEPDRGAHVAGSAGFDRYPPERCHRGVHGLVWPAGTVLHRSRAGLPRTASPYAGRATVGYGPLTSEISNFSPKTSECSGRVHRYFASIQVLEPTVLTATFVNQMCSGAPSAVPRWSIETSRGPAFL